MVIIARAPRLAYGLRVTDVDAAPRVVRLESIHFGARNDGNKFCF